MRSLRSLLLILLIPASPLSATAQEPVPGAVAVIAPATVSVSAEGAVTVTPDQATIRLTVLTRATTAREAGSMNARKQRAVIDALRALPIPADQIATSGFTLQPEMRYGPDSL